MLLIYLIAASLFGLTTSLPVVIFWFEVAAFVSMGWIPVAFVSGLLLVRLNLKWNSPQNLAAVGAFLYCIGYGLMFLFVWINNTYETTRDWAGLTGAILIAVLHPIYTALNVYLVVKLSRNAAQS